MRKLTLLLLVAGCTASGPAQAPVVLATTTSFQDSGLLEVLVSRFRAEGGPSVKAIAVGTGEALAMGKRGDVDGLTERLKDEREKAAARPVAIRRGPGGDGLVVIGVSTGGPRTLEDIIPQLSADFPWPVLIAQHMPAAFTRSFAERLNQICALSVVEAEHPMSVEPGSVYLGKGGCDMVLASRAGKLTVLPKPENSQFLWHPSVELRGRSVLEHCDPARVVAVMPNFSCKGWAQ